MIIAGLWLEELTWLSVVVIVGIWIVLVAFCLALDISPHAFVVLHVIADVILTLKLFGGDILIR